MAQRGKQCGKKGRREKAFFRFFSPRFFLFLTRAVFRGALQLIEQLEEVT